MMKTNEMTSIRFASEMSISFSSITQSPRTSLLANFSNQHNFQSHYTVFEEGTVTEFAWGFSFARKRWQRGAAGQQFSPAKGLCQAPIDAGSSY